LVICPEQEEHDMKATVLQIPLLRIKAPCSDAGSLADAVYKEGRRWEKVGDFSGALDCYEAALKLDSQHFDYLLRAGVVASQIPSHFSDAVYYLKSDLAINKESYEANTILAGMLDGIENEALREEALFYYQRALMFSPKEPLPYYRLGLIHKKMGDSLVSALYFFREGLRIAKERGLKAKIRKEIREITKLMP